MDDGTKKFAKKWKVSQSTVARWCREKKIPGATQDGPRSPWHISINAKDPRKR